MKISILGFLLLLIVISCSRTKPLDDGSKNELPNIIFIMTDDHAFQAISTYGSILMNTPNIDRLATEGMRFDKAYVTNSICSPSRAVALTGKFSHLNGVKDNEDVFDSAQVTFPKILRQHHFQTAIVGKWHLKSTPSGFDYWKVLPDQGDYYHPEFITPDGTVKEQGYTTDIITNLAIGYIDSVRSRDKPFMLMVHHKAPHREWWPSMENLHAFKNSTIPEPATLFDDYRNRGTAAREAEMRISDHMSLTMDNKVDPAIVERLNLQEFLTWYAGNYKKQYDRLTPEEKLKWDAVYGPINADFEKQSPSGKDLTYWKYHRYMEDYLASIQSVDDNIGRLIDYLDSTGLRKNTIIIYTSDQGFFLGEHGWFDKRFMYEPSFRTPLIISWPAKIKYGSVNNNLVQNIDFAPTILDAAGLQIPSDMQGNSLLPLLDGTNQPWRKSLYYHYYEYPGIHMVKRHYGVKTDLYKLMHFYYDVDEWEMYDFANDPDEINNIYGNPQYDSIQRYLHEELNRLRKQYGDSDELTQQMLEKDLQRGK